MIRPHVVEDPNKAYTTAQFETAMNATVANIPGINQFTRARFDFLRNHLNGLGQAADIRINEVTANNAGDTRDEAGDTDPWAEIHNLGPGPVTLNGFTLTDELDRPAKWNLPAVTLADGASLIVWLDGETNEGPAHASFRMPAAGGNLYLFASAVSATTALDSVTVESLPAGESQARAGLYGKRWTVTAQPTPAAENRLVVPARLASGTGELLINELMADNERTFEDPDEPGAFEDWFEVYNPGSRPVEMSGMYITDNPENPTKWRVGPGVTIPAGGYLIFMADNEPAQGPRHASFALSADGESISIYASDGRTLIDHVAFGPQRADVAFGRAADRGGAFTALSRPTPGGANAPAMQ